MDISTTISRRSSLSGGEFPRANPKYKLIFSHQESLGLRGYNPIQRLDANTQFIQTLQGQINKKINGSYLFTIGKQEKNERFAEVFVDFFREMRGTNPLISSSGDYLANKFVTSPDMCKIYETSTVDEYGIDTSTEISPTIQLIDELKQILEDEYGLQNQFLGALNKNGKRINDFAKLEDRDLFLATLPKDHPYRQKWGLQTAPVYIPLSMVAKIFPKCVEALKEVFNSLLITQWLKNDIDGVKLYLNENDYVDRLLPSLEEIELAVRLWETAKDYSEKQRKYDTEIEAKHWNEFQNDMWGTMVSGGLSICTVNPSFVIGKAAHTMMNVLSNQVDPEGSDKRVQVLKMFGGVGLGGVMGGNPWDLGTSLGVDLVELAVRDQKTTRGESALLTLWASILKGALTGDQKKLVCQILGGCVAEAANQLPETDENTSLERRIARALLTNSDVQAHFIKGFVDKRFKDDPKPKTGGVLTPEEQEKYPKQEPTLEDLQRQEEYEKQLAEYEQWEKDVATYNEGQRLSGLAISSKETEVKQAEKKMLKWWDRYQKAKGVFSSGSKEFNKYWKKRESYKKLSGELNTLKANQGLPQEDPFQKFVRKPTKPKGFLGVLDRAYDKTCDVAKKIGLGPSEVTVGSINLYEMKPSTVSDNYVPIGDSYRPPIINQPSLNLGWENVQAMQIEQMFKMNMAYQSPVDTSPQGNLDYQQFWGQGLNPNAQMPPNDWSGLGLNPKEHVIPGMKHYPDGDRTQSNIPKWLRYFASGGEPIDPQERINTNTQSLVATAKVAGQAFGEIADELRSFGCVNAKFDHGKVTLRFDRTISSQIDGLMDQFLPNMDHVPNFRYVEFTARIANDIMLEAFMMPLFQLGKAKPLLDRVLVRPQGFGQQVRMIEAFQKPALRSGFVCDKTINQIAQQQIRNSQTVFKFTGSAFNRLSLPERAVPIHIMKDIIKNPIAVTKDPQGVLHGSRMYYSRMYRNGKLYNVEVLYDKKLNKIGHFKYREGSLGPLERIKNK